MKQKIKPKKAIAFGFGKESVWMLKKYLKEKPLLIVCIGEKDTLDPEVAKMFAKALNLKIKIIKKTFREDVKLDEKYRVKKYSNTITKFYKDKKKPFDVLYVGRRKSDWLERTKLKDIILTKKIEGVEFPLWGRKRKK